MAKQLKTRIIHRCLWTVGILVLIVVLAIGGLALRLSEGPIDLGFAVERLERNFAPEDNSFHVDIASAHLAWEGWSRGIRLMAISVRVVREDGTRLANLPSVSVTVSPWRLAAGELVPTSIAIRDPALVLQRTAEGQISLGMEQTAQGGRGFVPGLLGALTGETETAGALDGLNEIQVVSGGLTIIDSAMGRTWQANDLQARVWRTSTGIRGELSFDLQIEDREFRFQGSVNHLQESRTTTARLQFTGLDPALFRAAEGPLQALGWFRMPINGTVSMEIDGSQRLTGGRLNINSGAGVIDIPEAYEGPLDVRSMSAVAQVSGDGSEMTFGPMRIVFDGPVLTLEGTLAQDTRRFTFEGRATFEDLPTDEIGVYWPRNLAGNARAWVAENISEGMVPELSVDVRLGIDREENAELELEHLLGRFHFEGISVRYLTYLPPVTKVDGRSEIYEDGMRFWATTGTLNEAQVTGAEAYIDWSVLDRGTMDLRVDAEGPLNRILEVIDRPPLGYATELGANPGAVGGQAHVQLAASYPLERELELSQVEIEVEARLHDVTWRRGLFGQDISDGEFRLALDKDGMTVNGPARLAETDVTLNWQEFFPEESEVQRRLDLGARVTDDLFARLGADLGSAFRGSAQSEVTILGRRDGTNQIEATLDLADARLVLPYLHIVKPQGQDGTARVTAVLAGERPRALPRIEITADGLELSASATFHDDGVTIKTLDVDRLSAGRTDATARVEGTADGRKTISIRGPSLDLAPALDADEEEEEPDGEEAADEEEAVPLVFDAQLERIYMSEEDHPIRNVHANLRYDGTFIRTLDFSGIPDGGSMLTIVLVPENGGQRFQASTAEGGALWRALGIFDKIRGGELTIDAQRPEVSVGTPFIGRAEMAEFQVVDVPELERLMIFDNGNGGTEGDGSPGPVEFTRFIAPFRFREGVIDIRNGRTNGPSVGLTFAGRIDIPGSQLDMDGTAVPAYRLNSLLGRIPGLGRVFVGERGSGVLAARWRAQGPFDDLQMEVDTLSVLTPGFTRYLLDIFRSDGDTDLDFDSPTEPPFPSGPPAMGP